jgi:hypothetical protein
LQVGYRRNKAGYKWNEIEDKFPLFLAARQIWASETEGEAPKKRDYPIVISPAITVADAVEQTEPVSVEEAIDTGTAELPLPATKKKK